MGPRAKHAEEKDGGGAPPAGARPMRADAVRNRARILEAAEVVFATEGIEAPVDAIAEKAGVGVGTLYRHFPTKEHLCEAILMERLSALAADARALAGRRGPGGCLLRLPGARGRGGGVQARPPRRGDGRRGRRSRPPWPRPRTSCAPRSTCSCAGRSEAGAVRPRRHRRHGDDARRGHLPGGDRRHLSRTGPARHHLRRPAPPARRLTGAGEARAPSSVRFRSGRRAPGRAAWRRRDPPGCGARGRRRTRRPAR